MNKINIVFCGYRDWANSIFDVIENHENLCLKKTIGTIEEYNEFVLHPLPDIEIFLFIGWSWIIPDYFTRQYLCIGIHPSDLPQYRGGSPIQNQILNGITKSKVSLITLSSKLDSGDIWMKEELSLIGDSIHNIFDNIVKSSIILLNSFFDLYPNIDPQKQDTTFGSYYKRRKPEDSKLNLEDFNNMTLQEMYNFIRGLTDPYPNAFLEDHEGNKLVFKNVTYIPSNK